MKKVQIIRGLIFGALVVVVVGLAGCGSKTGDNNLKDTKKDVVSKMEQGKEVIKNDKTMVGGLKDAMKRGVTMKCVVDSPDGHWVTYTNGKNSRTDGITTDKHEMAILMKDGVSYSWDKKTKKGQKISKKCMEDFQKSFGGSAMSEGANTEIFDDFTPEKLEVEENDGKLKCSPSTKADFSVPKDVQFTDQCELMSKQMDKLKQQMPNAFQGGNK